LHVARSRDRVDPAIVVSDPISVVNISGLENVAAFVALVPNELASSSTRPARAPSRARLNVDVVVEVLDYAVVHIGSICSHAEAVLPRKVR